MTDRTEGPPPPMLASAQTQLWLVYLKSIQLCLLGQVTLTPLNLAFPIREMELIIPTTDVSQE